MKNLSWKEKFNIPSDTDHSVADILRSGLMNEEDYLAWASETYQLPIVDAAFFKSAENHKLLLDNSSSEWTDTFFPILEWENRLYIACLEPNEIGINKPYSFVLAPIVAMESLWNKMDKPESDTLVEPSIEAPSLSALNGLSFGDGALASSLDLPPDDTPSSNSETPSENINSFDLSSLEVPKENPVKEPAIAPAIAEEPPLVFSEPPPAPTPAHVAAPVLANTPPPAKASGYENVFEQSQSQITSFFELTSTKNQISIPDFIVDELLKPAPVKPAPSAVNMNPNAKAENFDVPEITNVIKLGNKPEMTFTNTKTIMPFPERSTHFSFVRTVFSEQIILEARGKVKENTDPHQALISAFHILKDYYKKLMWAVRDQKGGVYAIASNTAWDFSEEAWNTPIDFKSPNPFRVAKFTTKPYHGEVYPNAVNDRFFQLWNNGKYPSILTVVPVKLQGKVFAYFVGCEPAMHFHPTNSLDIMQATCDELIQTFVAIHKELSAKAS
jgi:hypothetical protein